MFVLFVSGVRVQFQSSVCEYSVFPMSFVEETLLAPSWLPCINKDQLTADMWVYPWSLFYVSGFVSVPHSTVALQYALKSGHVLSLVLLFLKIALATQGPLWFPHIFKEWFFYFPKEIPGT